jgi:hypothetical protein
MNLFDWGVLVLVGVALFFAIRYLHRHGNPCGGCCGDCSQCKYKAEKDKSKK